jgi:hypothetical protein
MGAVKRFYEDCAVAGVCPVGRETWDYLDDIECELQLDWIGYCEHDYTGHDGRLYVQNCITIESARRLADEGLSNVEINSFLEHFAGFAPAASTKGVEP